jgi:hypothetical protein
VQRQRADEGELAADAAEVEPLGLAGREHPRPRAPAVDGEVVVLAAATPQSPGALTS